MSVRKLDDPNPCPAGYSLDLYCDHANPAHGHDEFPHNYFSETGGTCRRWARKAGWRLHADGTATCPKCVKALRAADRRNEHA